MPKTRLMWMFPRNIRRVDPWRLVQIAQVLEAASGDFSSQDIQDALYETLSDANVKRKRQEYGTNNSGGFRTYLAQMACLGLFWKDRKRDQYATTYAGEALLTSNNPAKILRFQLLRMQYPSVYGLGHNVAIDPSMKVKPFVFLVRLLQDERLGGFLTGQDLAIPVIYGRTFKDYERCVAKILRLRAGESLRSQVDSVDDLRTPRRNHPDDDEADWEKGLEDAMNIGNTARNYLIAAGLACSDLKEDNGLNTDSGRGECTILTDNEAILREIQPLLNEGEKIEPLDPQYQEAWQHRYGRYDKSRAPRSLEDRPKLDRLSGVTATVQSAYLMGLKQNPYGFDNATFTSEQAKKWTLDEADIAKMIAPLLSRTRNIQYDTLQWAACSGGAEALLLEKGITNIMKVLGFDLSHHIGQRKPPTNRKGGYPDIRVLASGMQTCGFADTKATSRYELGGGDEAKLQGYYHQCWQEFTDYEGDPRVSEFFLYIAGGFKSATTTIKRNLESCTLSYGKPVSAITVQSLLDLVQMEEKPAVEDLVKAFTKGKYYASADSILKETK